MGFEINEFSPTGQLVIRAAEEEAYSFLHGYLGPEHLLLGILREPHLPAYYFLNRRGVNLEKAGSSVVFIRGRGDRYATSGKLGFTPKACLTLDLAALEAKEDARIYNLPDTLITDSHILYGIIAEGNGLGAGVLEYLGLNLEQLRGEVKFFKPVSRLADNLMRRPATRESHEENLVYARSLANITNMAYQKAYPAAIG